jgi:Flp pilus assembly protein TadG
MLLLLLGIVQFAFIYNAQVGLTNAIRDSARLGSTLATIDTTSAGSTATATSANLTTRLGTYVSPYDAANLVTPSSQVCVAQHGDGTTSGPDPAFVEVTVVYDHPLFVPLVGPIIDAFDGASDGAYRITVKTELRIDNPDQSGVVIPVPVCDPVP